jgi:prepilin-type N-terminal cleavage/methylation domain-containing protein
MTITPIMRKKRLSLQAGHARRQAGFTLIEMLVSVALFAIVMVICVGALLSLVGANKKAQALESTINNLNITIDGMVRNLRQGSHFSVTATNCPGGNGDSIATDCTTGATAVSLITFTGQHWVYEYVSQNINSSLLYLCGTQTGTPGCIIRSEDGGNSFTSLTAPEVSITGMNFYVIGTVPGCDIASPCTPIQPRVIITIMGNAGATNNVKDSTAFHIQATALQRSLDL